MPKSHHSRNGEERRHGGRCQCHELRTVNGRCGYMRRLGVGSRFTFPTRQLHLVDKEEEKAQEEQAPAPVLYRPPRSQPKPKHGFVARFKEWRQRRQARQVQGK